MTITFCDIAINHKSGLAADACHMGLHYSFSSTPVSGDYATLGTWIEKFFTLTASGAGNYLGVSMADAVSTVSNAHTVRYYTVPNVRGPKGSPVATSTFTTGTVGSDGLPSELAVCVSLLASYGSAVEFGPSGTRPRARLRNRFYFGPLARNSLASDSTTKEVRVASSLLTNLKAAVKDFLQDGPDAAGWQLVVWSPTGWTDAPAVTVSVDDAFDIQRRRGVLPSVRTSLTL